MFKPALRLVARLLPLAAALLVSVAVGASTRTPESPYPISSKNETLPGTSLPTLQSVRFVGAQADRTDSMARPPIAQLDTSVLLASNYPVETLDTALTVPASAAVPAADARNKFEWPRPDRWMALLATLALGAFFFLRRIV